MGSQRGFWTQIDFLNAVVSLCGCIIFLVVVLKIVKHFQTSFQSSTESIKVVKFGRCKFPDCVRCRQQKSILMRARTKLTYCDDNPAATTTQLLNDIQASYQHLTSDVAQEVRENTIQNPLVFRLKGIRAQPVWDSEEFTGISSLTVHWEEIKQECAQLRQYWEETVEGKSENADSYWKVNNTPSGKWAICHLVDQGVETKATSLCPVTWREVSSLPCVMRNNLFGNIAFSFVEPGTTITTHCGPTNIRVRCHLGLRTPQRCQLKVADSTLEWTEGRLLCFDDSYPHRVDYPGAKGSEDSSSRLVLLVDLWHPDITAEQRSLIDYAFSPHA